MNQDGVEIKFNFNGKSRWIKATEDVNGNFAVQFDMFGKYTLIHKSQIEDKRETGK